MCIVCVCVYSVCVCVRAYVCSVYVCVQCVHTCTVCAYVYSMCVCLQCVHMFTDVCQCICFGIHTVVWPTYPLMYIHTYIRMYIRRCTEARYPCTLGGPYRQDPLHISTYVRNSGLVTLRVIQQDTTARSLYKDLLNS